MKPNAEHAAYGTACANCSRLKCRCIMPSPGSACERSGHYSHRGLLSWLTSLRCRRLGKDCLPLTMSRKRAPKKNATSRNQLEAKIDGLVSLLTSTRNQPTSVPEGESAKGEQGSKEDDHQPTNESTTPSYPEDTVDGANEIFREFCELKLAQFPFIFIPVGTSATDMASKSPFLWLCIVAVSSKSTSHQSTLYARIRSVLGKSMIEDLEKSVDHLLGLLVCIAWSVLDLRTHYVKVSDISDTTGAAFSTRTAHSLPCSPSWRSLRSLT